MPKAIALGPFDLLWLAVQELSKTGLDIIEALCTGGLGPDASQRE